MNSNKKKLSLILGGLLIFFVIITIGGVEMTAQPGFCNSCHSMGSDYKTWQTSTHKEISCLKCHADPGLVGLIKVKLGGLNQVWVTATGTTPEKITAEVPNQRCLECHKGKLKPKGPDEINFDHSKHLKSENNCTQCHARVVHTEVKETVKDVKTNCINCHTKKNVKVLKCSDCHQSKHKDNYQVTHSSDVAKSTEDCMECHAKNEWAPGIPGVGKNFCNYCHKVSMPHKKEFVKKHGAESNNNKESCLQCHNSINEKMGSKARVCISCHKLEIPHKKDFKDKHPQSFKKNPTVCTTCHNSTNEKAGFKAQNCSTCHSKINVHNSNWMGKHYSESNKSGANCLNCHSSQGKELGFKVKTCYECHNQGHKSGFIKVHESKFKAQVVECTNCHKTGGIANTCNTCHKVNMPHSTGWDKTHGKTAKVNQNACNLCHSPKNPVNPKTSNAKAGFCTSCHKANYKHSSDTWGFDHGTYYKTNPTLCTVCHVRKNDCLICHGPKW